MTDFLFVVLTCGLWLGLLVFLLRVGAWQYWRRSRHQREDEDKSDD